MSESFPRTTPEQNSDEAPWENPPAPLLPDGQVDLNELAAMSRRGETRPVMTIAEALAAPGGFHNAHMVNPERHPRRLGDPVVDLGAVRDALEKARMVTLDDQPRGESAGNPPAV